MLSAKEAREKINNSTILDIEKEWKFIENEINKAIQAKHFSIYLNQLSEENIKRLQNLGYNYRVIDGSGYRRWKISWET